MCVRFLFIWCVYICPRMFKNILCQCHYLVPRSLYNNGNCMQESSTTSDLTCFIQISVYHFFSQSVSSFCQPFREVPSTKPIFPCYSATLLCYMLHVHHAFQLIKKQKSIHTLYRNVYHYSHSYPCLSYLTIKQNHLEHCIFKFRPHA